MNSLVSIITPVFNSQYFLKECIESVISQTYKNWEMLIIDDCSKDASRKIINSFAKKEPRIRSFFLNKNIGPAMARNIGLRNARGNYIAFLDSDDLWLSSKLEKQIFFMSTNNIAFSYTSYQVISEQGTVLKNLIKVPKKMSYKSYLKNTIIGCLTVIVDKSKVGFFEMPDLKSSHDMALWLLIMKRGFYAYGLNESLAKYRIVNNSNTFNKLNASMDVWNLYRKQENLSFFYSLFNFIFYVFNALKKRIL